MAIKSGGSKGIFVRFSTVRKAISANGEITAAEITTGWSQPHTIPLFTAIKRPPTPMPRVRAPGTSKLISDFFSVSGRVLAPIKSATITSNPWTIKSVLQPNHSIKGPPVTTPMAGDTATTAIHIPNAFERSFRP